MSVFTTLVILVVATVIGFFFGVVTGHVVHMRHLRVLMIKSNSEYEFVRAILTYILGSDFIKRYDAELAVKQPCIRMDA